MQYLYNKYAKNNERAKLCTYNKTRDKCGKVTENSHKIIVVSLA